MKKLVYHNSLLPRFAIYTFDLAIWGLLQYDIVLAGDVKRHGGMGAVVFRGIGCGVAVRGNFASK